MARLPPLNPLHVFEVAARLESFTRAAQELGVTPSAVSRQIALLESYLGTPLFRREATGVVLTDVARAYGRDVTGALQQIQAATDRAFSSQHAAPLTLRLYPTLAAKWLLPRLGAFEARHPDVEIRLTIGYAPVNFAQEDVDAAIMLGDGQWPRYLCDRLLPDEITPVCSTALLRGARLKRIDDLRRVRLLHSQVRQRDWPDWLSHVGHGGLTGGGELAYPNSALLYQAAIEGLGVAMGQPRLLDHDIRAGLLVSPFKQRLVRDQAYYLVRPEWRPMSPKLRAFRTWILDAAADRPSPKQR